jgi:hypothetical protein
VKRPIWKALWPGLLLLGTALACSLGGDAGANQAATVTAIAGAVAGTAEANAEAAQRNEAAAATANALAADAANAAATTGAIVAADAANAAAATAAALVPIQAELTKLGLDPNTGRLGWTHEPVTIRAEGYLQYDYANQNLLTVAEDFVMAADIRWNTRFGTSGCGYVIRSDGDEEAFNQYLIIATRGANGHVGFITQRAGEIIPAESFDIYANGLDPLFAWQNDTTNRLVVIGRGDQFLIYTNGTLIGAINAVSGFAKGFNAFVALNESGDTTCRFENAWLWLLE